jgi:hypothetical protein
LIRSMRFAGAPSTIRCGAASLLMCPGFYQ